MIEELTAGINKRDVNKIKRKVNIHLCIIANESPLRVFQRKYNMTPKEWLQKEKQDKKAKKKNENVAEDVN
jgi:hypothetical protein